MTPLDKTSRAFGGGGVDCIRISSSYFGSGHLLEYSTELPPGYRCHEGKERNSKDSEE